MKDKEMMLGLSVLVIVISLLCWLLAPEGIYAAFDMIGVAALIGAVVFILEQGYTKYIKKR